MGARRLRLGEIVVLRLRDGTTAEAWIVFDFGGLWQQLEAPAALVQ
jgi:hypothetical protein